MCINREEFKFNKGDDGGEGAKQDLGSVPSETLRVFKLWLVVELESKI